MADTTMSSEPKFNASSGYWEAQIDSRFQASLTAVQILLPSHLAPARHYPVLYILPVVPHGDQFGSGMVEAKRADLANKYGIICVYPSLTGTPWFGNSATNPQDQQDDYIVRVLVPYIDEHYPTLKTSEGRWLIGFSKSGWGAYTLLLRHSDIFGYAAAWDTPFMIDGSGQDWGPMGLSVNMGTRDNLLQFLPTRLIEAKATQLKARTHLVLGRGQFWKVQVEQMHALLDKAGIPHRYLPDLLVSHRWDTGWFPTEVAALVDIARDKPRQP